MRYICFIFILAISQSACSNDDESTGYEPWVTQFRYTNGWGKFEVIWVNSDGKSGYANLGNSSSLPCQFKLTDSDKSTIVANLNKVIKNPKPSLSLGEESYSCSDETRVSVNVSHEPRENGVVGFLREMSMMKKCNNFAVDDNLFSAAAIAYENIEKLPRSCKIYPLKK